MLFGSPSYAAGQINFALLVDGGIVLTRLRDDQKNMLISDYKGEYFTGHGRVIRKWIFVPLRDPEEIERVLPFITASYASAVLENESGTA